MADLPLAACWPLALSLLVTWPLLLAILGFVRLLRPGLLLWLGLPVLLVATASSVLAVMAAPDLSLSLALGGWASPLGIQWVLDQPAAWLLVTLNLISALASLAAWLMGRSLGGSSYFWPLWWLLWSGMNALVISGDLFNIYVTLELVTLAAVGLVAQSRNDPEGKAAMDYLMASLLASLLYLLGVALIYGQTGVLDLQVLTGTLQADALTALAALLMTLGLLLKAAVVPLHFWLPRAHSRAQAPVSVLLSSVVIALAIYLLWRLWLGPFLIFLDAVTWVFALLAGVCLVWGGIQAFLQERLKLVLAYSTLSQLGFALMLLTLLPEDPEAVWAGLPGQGALVFLLAHGLAKAALFMAAGALVLVYAEDGLKALQGSYRVLPLAWLAVALASISLLGAPPTAGFVGKWQLLQASLSVDDYWTAGLLLLGTLMTAIYLFRVMQFAWKKPQRSDTPQVTWRARGLAWLALVTAALSWVLGSSWLGYYPWTLFEPLALDALGWAFFWPVMLIWPLVLVMARVWRASRLLMILLLLGWGLNLLLVLAQDLLVFYIAFALLSFLGWWLVIHSASPQALAAGRVYLGMSLVGELAFFTALGLLAHFGLAFADLADQQLPGSALMALGLAFAIKAGVLGVHIWLPWAHPVAPTPASAVLSGLMIKAGVLGWLRIFPHQAGLETWGLMLLVLGLLASLYAVLRGLLQENPKSLLAWSSVSQMGLITALLGVLLLSPENQPLVLSSVLLLVMTHALAKAALFLGVGLSKTVARTQQVWVLAGMLLASLTLVGVPFTSGVLVKSGLEASLQVAGWPAWLLIASSLATALLLGRLLLLLKPLTEKAQTERMPGWVLVLWWLLVVLAASFAWLWPQQEVQAYSLTAWDWVKAWLPMFLAGLLLLVSQQLRWSAIKPPNGRPGLLLASWQPRTRSWSLIENLMQTWAGVGFLLAVVAGLFGGMLAYSLLG